MMYFATFASGLQEIIGKRLAQFPNVELSVHDVQDTVVIFESSLTQNQLSELRFLNNVYELLAEFTSPEQVDITNLPVPELKGTFIVRRRAGAQPSELPQGLADTISAKTHAALSAHHPANELLLWERTDHHVLWGKALPRPGFKTRRLEPGEIRPEFAHAMCLFAGLDHKHNVLDPFAGYGAIVREALVGFHAEEVIGVEYNEHLVPHLKSIPHLIAKHGDAARLPHIETRSIDRVITDPPWGKFEHATPQQLEHLYHESLIQMHRVLRAKGCAVILTAVPFLANQAVEIGFIIEREYHVLVNGQKATLYKIRKVQN